METGEKPVRCRHCKMEPQYTDTGETREAVLPR